MQSMQSKSTVNGSPKQPRKPKKVEQSKQNGTGNPLDDQDNSTSRSKLKIGPKNQNGAVKQKNWQDKSKQSKHQGDHEENPRWHRQI